MRYKMRKTNMGNIVVYLLYLSLFPPYFIPTGIQQAYRIVFTVIVLLYLLSKGKKGILLNDALLVSASIIVSCLINYLIGSDNSIKAFLDGVLYATRFYCIFSLFSLFSIQGKSQVLLRCLFKITVLHCVAILLFLNTTFGRSEGDLNLWIYILGNKFSSCYFFLLLVGLYYANFAHKIRDKFLYKIGFLALILITAALAVYYDCSTVIVASIVPLIIFLFPTALREKLYNPVFVLGAVIAAAILPFLLEVILSNTRIQYLIVNVLHRNLKLSGRMNIYTRYLLPVISEKWVWGHGYTNDAIRSVSIAYSNAQNGLLQYIVRFGVIGGIVIVLFIVRCFRRSSKSESTVGAMMLFYAMLTASIVEVTYNWYLFIGLALLAFLKNDNKVG